MALWSEGRKIYMNEGDYGISLPFNLTSEDIESGDKMRFYIKKNSDAPVLLAKEYSNELFSSGKFFFALDFTKKESYILSKGNYVYYLEQIRGNEVANTIISEEPFIIKGGIK